MPARGALRRVTPCRFYNPPLPAHHKSQQKPARTRTDVGIIGGGVAGLACAFRLNQLVTQKLWDGSFRVYEREEQYGGRVATFVTTTNYWDYGFSKMAQPQQPSFTEIWKRLGNMFAYSAWPLHAGQFDFGAMADGKSHDEYVKQITASGSEEGHRKTYAMTPSSRYWLRHLWNLVDMKTGQRIFLSHTVVSVQKWDRGQWVLKFQNGRTMRCDVLVLACPPEQALPFFEGTDKYPLPDPDETPVMKAALSARYNPGWVVLLGLRHADALAFDEVKVLNHPVVHTITSNTSKPDRPQGADILEGGEGQGVTSITIQCTVAYSLSRMDAEPQAVVNEVMKHLKADMHPVITFLSPPNFVAAHLWPHAYPTSAAAGLAPGWAPYDARERLGVCGDWVTGPQVEDAWASGIRLANSIAGREDLDEVGVDGIELLYNMDSAMYQQLGTADAEASQRLKRLLYPTIPGEVSSGGAFSWMDIQRTQGNAYGDKKPEAWTPEARKKYVEKLSNTQRPERREEEQSVVPRGLQSTTHGEVRGSDIWKKPQYQYAKTSGAAQRDRLG